MDDDFVPPTFVMTDEQFAREEKKRQTLNVANAAFAELERCAKIYVAIGDERSRLALHQAAFDVTAAQKEYQRVLRGE